MMSKDNTKNMAILDKQDERVIGNPREVKLFEDATEMLDKESRRGEWKFSSYLSEALFVKNLYSTRKVPLQYIGMVNVTVNIGFIQDLISNSGLFSEEDFLVLVHLNEMSSFSENLPLNRLIRRLERNNERLPKQDYFLRI